MVKTLIFDSGPVINFALNNLLWLFEPLKKKFKGKFYVTPKVKEELIKNPLQTKKFKFEALQILQLFDKKILEDYNKQNSDTQQKLFNLFNSIYVANGENLEVVHSAEVEAISTAIILGADAVVIDERTTRLMLEEPKLMARIFERKLHTKVKINHNNLKLLLSMTKSIRMIRSMELVVYAYEQGLLNKYLSSSISKSKETLLDAIIWGLKLHGCSIAMKDMKEIVKIESKRRS